LGESGKKKFFFFFFLESRLGRNTWIAPINPFIWKKGQIYFWGHRAGGYNLSEAIENFLIQARRIPSQSLSKSQATADQNHFKSSGSWPTGECYGQYSGLKIAILANSTVELQAGFLTPACTIFEF